MTADDIYGRVTTERLELSALTADMLKRKGMQLQPLFRSFDCSKPSGKHLRFLRSLRKGFRIPGGVPCEAVWLLIRKDNRTTVGSITVAAPHENSSGMQMRYFIESGYEESGYIVEAIRELYRRRLCQSGICSVAVRAKEPGGKRGNLTEIEVVEI